MYNILQIASFNGNIGDVANHNGFRNSFKKYIDAEVKFHNLEMRQFYRNWNISQFDDGFAEEANKYDAVFMGGGGFFSTTQDYSVTGCTIDMSKEVIDSIKVPIIFNSIGFSTSRNTTDDNIKKFKEFMDYCLNKGFLFTVRNDGSKEHICEIFGDSYQALVLSVPDGGFFVEVPDYEHSEFGKEEYIAINVAADQTIERFGDESGKQQFIYEMGKFINILCAERNDIRIVFVPHIFSDYSIINDITQKIEDRILRTRISCAPCYSGTNCGGVYNFDIYKNAKCVLGMRYHTNVCSIGLGVPTIGIGSMDKVPGLYHDLQLHERMIMATDELFQEKILELTEKILNNPETYREENSRIMNRLVKQNTTYFAKIKEVLERRSI